MTAILAHIPEVPVKETWEWLTDLLVSEDGTEQRIALRGVPRVTQASTYLFVTQDPLQNFTQTLLTALNKLWLPEWHFSTRTTAQTNSGAARLYFDPALTDIRVGEWVIVGNAIYTVTTSYSDGVSVTPNLSATAPAGSLVAPVAEAILDDNSGFSRKAVNQVGESSLVGTYNRPRTALIRPGTSSTVTLWNSVPVLTPRPLANDDLQESIRTNQMVIDNSVSAIELIDRWDYPRAGGRRQFMVNRTPLTGVCNADTLQSLDYWRHFFTYVKGSQRKFWMPTYRPDLTWVSGTGTNLTVSGVQYAQDIFPAMPSHKFLQVTTTTGAIYRCTVSAASVSGANSSLTITPTRPAGTIAEISFLIPVRLASDSVEFEHYGLYSMLNLSVRTAE